MIKQSLKPEQLYTKSNPEDFGFKTTTDLEEMMSPLGQERAINAVNFGINVHSKGYNLFCLGPEGTGKTSLVKHILKKSAKSKPVPNDWCYVNNFDDNHKPRALKLPAGRASGFAKDMEKLVDNLKISIPAAFESDEYKEKLASVEEKYKEQKSNYFDNLQKQASGKNVSLLRMPVGLVVAPMHNGEVLSPEAFEKLPEDEQKALMKELNETQEKLEIAVRDVPKWEKDQREEVSNLNKKITNAAVSGYLDEIKKKYKDIKAVTSYLKQVHNHIIENVDQFFEEEEEENPILAAMKRSTATGEQSLRQYLVNPIVRNEEKEGAPIVFADHPTYSNLFGRVERQQLFGALISDFNLIKAGSLHEANGGYLLIDARKLLSQPSAWDSLKRAIRSKNIKIEQTGDDIGFSTITLDPEPIPLDVKIILIGEADLYYTLASLDPDFGDLFKVEADFCSTMERTRENEAEYAKLIGSLSKKKQLRSLNNYAVARIVEHASRLAGDANKLTAHIASIGDLVREADYFARASNSNIIGCNHVEQAIKSQIYRSDRVRESMMEQITRNVIKISTSGEVAGQINGLVVYEFGRISFGRPTRITCLVRMGKGDVIDIEREVELGGPIHTKGVLILQSLLGSRFSKDKPLSLTASLVFEQSYGEVDGDSASSAEYYALISAISGIPIKQNFAVTGSVDQFGRIQPIGGVNEKIEGFFDVCKGRGLDGTHGVLIPENNVKNLMLKQEIVDAVRDGLFHVYDVSTVDEGIEILTGIPAGGLDDNGEYPMGTVNRKVENRLKQLFTKSMEYGNQENKKG
ncbi:MAG: AAA family ATPase [Alphaproteobacteria bacterium]